MATSSITHNFVITDSKHARMFANALEEAEREYKNAAPRRPAPGRELKDPEEIKRFLAKRKT